METACIQKLIIKDNACESGHFPECRENCQEIKSGPTKQVLVLEEVI